MSAYLTQQYPQFTSPRPDRWHVYVTVEPSTFEQFPSLAATLNMRITGLLSIDGYDAKATVIVDRRSHRHPRGHTTDVRPPFHLEEGSSFIERAVQVIEDAVEDHMEQLQEVR